MCQCASTVAARLLELGDREQGIISVVGQRIFDDHPPVVTLGLRRGERHHAVPVQAVTIGGRERIRCTQQGVHERATSHAIALAHETARVTKERIVRRPQLRGGQRLHGAVTGGDDLCIGRSRGHGEQQAA
jgi:hypothetical protein